MIEELANLVDDFPGPANQTRCFLHILNLVVKSVIRQFDIPKSKKTLDSEDDDEGMEEAVKELLKLAGDVNLEEETTANAGNEEDTTEDDNEQGWVDELEELTEEELLELGESVQPVRLLLTKVRSQFRGNTLLSNMISQLRKIVFMMKNSTTIVLPQWFTVLQELGVPEQMMPRDVRTRWNSTFDMLDFAVEHLAAINIITSNRDMKLRKYELSEDDWYMAIQLRDVLKVRDYRSYVLYSHWLVRSSRTQHYSFPEGRQASLPSYRPWTILTNTLPPLHSVTTIASLSRLPLQLAKKLSIGTTTKQITPESSGLLWV
jgi:hypothetical protein